MFVVLVVLHVIACVGLIFIILLQHRMVLWIKVAFSY